MTQIIFHAVFVCIDIFMVYLDTEFDKLTSITSLPSNQAPKHGLQSIFRMIAMLLFYIFRENCLKLLPTTFVCRLLPEMQ
jgi:hypothetical protein